VATQPGCRWSVGRTDSWLSLPQSNATGSGTLYVYVASTRVARTATVRVYPDWGTGDIMLTDGTFGTRSALVPVEILRPLYQFVIREN